VWGERSFSSKEPGGSLIEKKEKGDICLGRRGPVSGAKFLRAKRAGFNNQGREKFGEWGLAKEIERDQKGRNFYKNNEGKSDAKRCR